MAGLARPTLRCLREDLALTVPRADTPLEEISHPLLAKAKANERFADDQTPHERVAAIDDEVLFKVKAQRWRGAIWVDAGIPWLVAAGLREEGSPEDFYASLAARGRAARARYNAEHSPPLTSTTYTGHRSTPRRWRTGWPPGLMTGAGHSASRRWRTPNHGSPGISGHHPGRMPPLYCGKTTHGGLARPRRTARRGESPTRSRR
jgi:hypothetical protein